MLKIYHMDIKLSIEKINSSKKHHFFSATLDRTHIEFFRKSEDRFRDRIQFHAIQQY